MKKFILAAALLVAFNVSFGSTQPVRIKPLTFKQKWEIAIDDLFRYDKAVDENSSDTTMILGWLEEDFDNLSPYLTNIDAHLENAYGARGGVAV